MKINLVISPKRPYDKRRTDKDGPVVKFMKKVVVDNQKTFEKETNVSDKLRDIQVNKLRHVIGLAKFQYPEINKFVWHVRVNNDDDIDVIGEFRNQQDSIQLDSINYVYGNDDEVTVSKKISDDIENKIKAFIKYTNGLNLGKVWSDACDVDFRNDIKSIVTNNLDRYYDMNECLVSVTLEIELDESGDFVYMYTVDVYLAGICQTFEAPNEKSDECHDSKDIHEAIPKIYLDIRDKTLKEFHQYNAKRTFTDDDIYIDMDGEKPIVKVDIDSKVVFDESLAIEYRALKLLNTETLLGTIKQGFTEAFPEAKNIDVQSAPIDISPIRVDQNTGKPLPPKDDDLFDLGIRVTVQF